MKGPQRSVHISPSVVRSVVESSTKFPEDGSRRACSRAGPARPTPQVIARLGSRPLAVLPIPTRPPSYKSTCEGLGKTRHGVERTCEVPIGMPATNSDWRAARAAACVGKTPKCIGPPLQAAAFRGTPCRVFPSPCLRFYRSFATASPIRLRPSRIVSFDVA